MSVRTELPSSEPHATSMSLHAVVKGKGKGGRQWKEIADLVSASQTGSSFNLARRCEVGTLILLMIPLPVHMRCYDHDTESYRVWGLVQHCAPMTAGNPSRFHIGVAFIGRDAPESYKGSPLQQYRISGVDNDGMWSVEELKTGFKKRSQVRFWQPVDLYLALVDTKLGSIGGEKTIAENVSRNGAAVFTTLEVGIGDRVKFICELYDFSGLAVVCNRQTGDDGRTRLHLKFVENTFPIEALMRASVAVEEV